MYKYAKNSHDFQNTKNPKNQAGGAYIFVLMIMLITFLVVGTILGITATSRIISSRYMEFTGFHNLATAANEQVLLLFQQEISQNSENIIENIQQMLENDGLEQHLVFYDGSFYLSDSSMQFFRDAANAVIVEFLQSLNNPIIYTLQANAERYEVITTITTNPPISTNPTHYNVSTIVRNIAPDRVNNPITVSGTIHLPDFSQTENSENSENSKNSKNSIEVLPIAYKWRNEPPNWLQTAQTQNATFLDWDMFTPLASRLWHEETAIYISNFPVYTANFEDAPTLVVHTSYSSYSTLQVNAAAGFNGVIIAPVQIEIIEGNLTGSVISGGAITGDPLGQTVYSISAHTNENFIFDLVHIEDVPIIFDFLGISNFSAANTSNIASVLGYLEIDDFQLDENSILQMFENGENLLVLADVRQE